MTNDKFDKEFDQFFDTTTTSFDQLMEAVEGKKVSAGEAVYTVVQAVSYMIDTLDDNVSLEKSTGLPAYLEILNDIRDNIKERREGHICDDCVAELTKDQPIH